jgi:hypothetical protein
MATEANAGIAYAAAAWPSEAGSRSAQTPHRAPSRRDLLDCERILATASLSSRKKPKQVGAWASTDGNRPSAAPRMADAARLAPDRPTSGQTPRGRSFRFFASRAPPAVRI